MRNSTINKTLFVGRLNPAVTGNEITKLFNLYGTVRSVAMGTKKCEEEFNYCYVRMSSIDEANQCLETLNNSLFKGEQILVRF